MGQYLSPSYGPEELVSTQDCFARAQRALEGAEVLLEHVLAKAAGAPSATQVAEFATARAQVAAGWTALGAALLADKSLRIALRGEDR